jgi:hypothetical protein
MIPNGIRHEFITTISLAFISLHSVGDPVTAIRFASGPIAMAESAAAVSLAEVLSTDNAAAKIRLKARTGLMALIRSIQAPFPSSERPAKCRV